MRSVMQLRQFQIAKPFGIPLILDSSWLLMAVLHVWLFSQFWLARGMGDWWPQWAYFVVGTVVTTLFFLSILFHELAHALMARFEGIEIYDIQLHIFGGWARLIGEPRTALAELRVAIVGPASSFLLGVFFWLCLVTVQLIGARNSPAAEAAASSFKYLMAANLTLAMFNLLPGLPLDGGRVLRAWLWHRRGDIVSATRTAKRFGVAIAYMLISYGIFLVSYDGYRGRLWQDFMAAAWLLLVGIFLMNAAEQDYRIRLFQQNEAKQQSARWNIAGTVGAVMRTPPVSVLPDLKISEFIERVLAKHRQTSFPVARDGRLHGMLLLQRLRDLPREEWGQVIVREVMEPIDESHFVTVRASIEHATRKLKSNQIGQLAVIDGEGFLVGSLCETDLSA